VLSSPQRACWEYFLDLYQKNEDSDGDPPLLFVKLFNTGGRLKALSRRQLLSKKKTFFYNWLQMAGTIDDHATRFSRGH